MLAGLIPLLAPVFKDLLDRAFPNEAERTRAEAELHARLVEITAQAQIAQIETNKVEAAHSNIFVAGWRPAVGWVCVAGLAYNFILYPLLLWAVPMMSVTIIIPPMLTDHLLELILGMLGLGALRTFEKAKGITR